MVMSVHPVRFMEEIGGLFSFSIEKVAEVNTDGGSSSCFFLLVVNTSSFYLFKTFDICSACSEQDLL